MTPVARSVKRTSRGLALFAGLLPLDRGRLPLDVIAGATLAALAIPEVMGYAKIAGTPVVTGLYTLLLLISAVSFGKPATPLMSFSRYLLVAFPLFITLATLLESRRAMGAWLSFSAGASWFSAPSS